MSEDQDIAYRNGKAKGRKTEREAILKAFDMQRASLEKRCHPDVLNEIRLLITQRANI